MAINERKKWVRLTFVIDKAVIRIDYEDGRGRKTYPKRDPGNKIDSVHGEILMPAKIKEWLDQMLGSVTVRRRGKQNPPPLAIYLQIHSLFFHREFRSLVKEWTTALRTIIFPDLLRNESRYTLIIDNDASKGSSFISPLSLLLGLSKETSLYNNLRDKTPAGFLIQSSFSWQHFSAGWPDIMICRIHDFLLATIEVQQRPCLVVLINDSDAPMFYPRYRSEQSFIIIDAPDELVVLGFFTTLLNGIANDYPLHEAFLYACDDKGEYLLMSSPVGTQGLRITGGRNAFERYVKGRRTRSGDLFYISPAPPPKFDIPDSVKRKVGSSEGDGGSGDGGGYIPVPYEAAEEDFAMDMEYDEVQDAEGDDGGGWHTLAPPEFEENAVEDDEPDLPERVVDATLKMISKEGEPSIVSADNTLLPGHIYRLSISIGKRSKETLMSGPQVPIDPLLAEPDNKDGYLLDVVVFAKDFTLASPNKVVLKLPLYGSSDKAAFTLRAPEIQGRAELRFAVFHKNNLLQSFLLNALVGSDLRDPTGPQIRVTLDVSNSRRFTNLDKLKKRDLYIGLNGNGDGSHTLFIKDDKITSEIQGLTETLINMAQQEYATLLDSAYFNGNNPRFPVDATADADPAPFFEEVRKLGRFGSDLYRAIFKYNGYEAREELIKVRNRSDLNLQITRHNVNYAFPWAVLYDYLPPPEITGAAPAPVCMGAALNPALYPEFHRADGCGCPHNPNLYTFCTSGFWGYRHCIEQLIPSAGGFDSAVSIRGGKQKLIYSNNFSDEQSVALEKYLAAYQPLVLRKEHNWAELLWDPGTRPSAFVVFGHLESGQVPGQPAENRICSFLPETWPASAGQIPLDKWVYDYPIDSRVMDNKIWTGDPLALVMLISCYNMGMKVNSLSSLVNNFRLAGASAVIGTECDITSDLGRLFISEILHSLYDEKLTLGEAIRKFNQKCFSAFNPLPLVFSCFGNSDLTIN